MLYLNNEEKYLSEEKNVAMLQRIERLMIRMMSRMKLMDKNTQKN